MAARSRSARGVGSPARRAAWALAPVLAGAGLVPLARAPLLEGLTALLVTGSRDVAWIAPADLGRARLAQPSAVLLDARSEAEFAVSRLPGARLIDPDAPDLSALGPLPKDTPIVVYCAVGYRSGRVARRLMQAGYSRVANLEGGAFRWAREGRPLVDDAGPTRRVHPNGAVWGWLLLDPALRAPAG